MSNFEANGDVNEVAEGLPHPRHAPPAYDDDARVGWGPRRPLACEPTANAELLSATHVCTCEVTEVRAVPAPDGGATGMAEVTLRVLASFKGELAAGDETVAVVDLGRPGDGRPRPASRHVLLATDTDGPVQVARAHFSPASASGPLGGRSLLSFEHVADVIAAEEAEAAFDRAIRVSPVEDADLEAARAVLRVGLLRADAVHRAFVDYVFARVTGPLMRAYRTSPRPLATGPVLAALFAIAARDAVLPEVRARVVEGAAQLAVGAANRCLARDVGRALLVALLDRPADAPRMVDQCIHPVLFDPRGRARLRSFEVLSDPLLRARAARVLDELATDRARRLAVWVASTPSRRAR